ncbi:hypothetical protein ILUMI_03497 [Ignelater luminosus]|uniref:Uncharacterized protein n=1 Tax=Ignelater luminosus TaxID=2038154 RepID=A0A8K0DEF7_IGNLU|nr:hypothetical protein ILUMI_03497 [Ignelater luminosus]
MASYEEQQARLRPLLEEVHTNNDVEHKNESSIVFEVRLEHSKSEQHFPDGEIKSLEVSYYLDQGIMGRNVRSQHPPPNSLDELRQSPIRVWEDIPNKGSDL